MLKYIIENIRTNDPLFNVYKRIYNNLKYCEDIENIMINYLDKIIKIAFSSKINNKTKCISIILEDLYQELNDIYVYYNSEYEEEMEGIKRNCSEISKLTKNNAVINNNIKSIRKIVINLHLSNNVRLL